MGVCPFPRSRLQPLLASGSPLATFSSVSWYCAALICLLEEGGAGEGEIKEEKKKKKKEKEKKKRKKIEISDRKHTRVSSGTMNAGIRQLEVTLMSSVDLFNCQLDLDGVHKELALPEREREKESRSGLNGIINNKTALSIKCWSVKWGLWMAYAGNGRLSRG